METNNNLQKIALTTAGIAQLGLITVKVMDPTSMSMGVTLLPTIATASVAVASLATVLVSNLVKTQKGYRDAVILVPKTEEELENEKNKPVEYESYSIKNGKEYHETSKIIDNKLINKKYELINLKEVLLSVTETELDENYNKALVK